MTLTLSFFYITNRTPCGRLTFGPYWTAPYHVQDHNVINAGGKKQCLLVTGSIWNFPFFSMIK